MQLVANNINELEQAAKQLLSIHQQQRLFAFYGEMGAGKTTFIKSICKELGVTENTSSPTFSLVNEYKTKSGETIFHFDFYRINKLPEVYDMGYEDYFYSGAYCFVEWPEKVESLMPEETVKVRIKEAIDGQREIMIS